MCSFEGIILHTGVWSSGMIGVSKTFGGSSILSTPANNFDFKETFISLFF